MLSILAILAVVAHALPEIRIRGDPASAGAGIAARMLGAEAAKKFEFSSMAPVDGVDAFKLGPGSQAGTVAISGNTGVSIGAGLNHYIKYYLNSTVSWGGDQITIPSDLPIPATTTKKRGTKYFYAWNVCTAGYTAAGWNWTRWERELDFQAMEGVSFPLSFTGQEWAWAQTFADLGVTEPELDAFLSGSHFLPWGRMGNIRGWGGPLDADWREGQRELQTQIVQRQLELGMIPVLPAFAGHVPAAMTKLFPNSSFTTASTWGNFPPQYTGDTLLDPTDPLYQRIGTSFIKYLLQGFNLTVSDIADAGFNSDTFNEIEPKNSSLAYLKACNEAVYQSIVSVVPKATYVMQGWLFHEGFWTADRTQAYLSGVPDDGMIILDLNTEQEPVWTKYQSFYGKPWIWNALLDYGGRRGMFGNLSVLAVGTVTDRPSHNAGSTMVGIGYTPEAIETNPVYYELLCEMAWRDAPLDVSFPPQDEDAGALEHLFLGDGSDPFDQITTLTEWLDLYAMRRYGSDSADARAAWRLLRRAGYQYNWGWGAWSVLEYSPAVGMKVDTTYNATEFTQAMRLLAKAGTDGDINPDLATYRYDLVDVTRQVLSNFLVDIHALSTFEYRRFQEQNQNSSASFLPLVNLFLQGIDDMDALLSTNEYFLLGQWLNDAIRSPTTKPADLKNRLFNAKNQITLWGPTGEINDYAAKQWGGLVRSYYKSRWTLLLSGLSNAVKTGVHFDFDKYETDLLTLEQAWGNSQDLFPENPQGSTQQAVDAILKNYATAPTTTTYQTIQNTDYSGGDLLIPAAWTTDTAQLQILCTTDPNCIGFNSNGYLKNSTATKISSVGTTFYLKN